MKTVHEVSALTGVSVRTLHHYDAIGLLKPTKVTEAQYRLYDDTALARLQTILLFRELQFPLRDIAAIIDSPQFDKKAALRQQIKLLELRERRLGKIIALARNIEKTGVNEMDFSAFDKAELEKQEAEVKKKWGSTEAYREYSQKTKNYTPEDKKEMGEQMMSIFAKLGEQRALAPDSVEAQETVKALRQFITDNFYNCTPEIFACLGQMYSAGGEMTENIDKAGGDGTAAFASEAISIYCNNMK